jgi:hypothetical protein
MNNSHTLGERTAQKEQPKLRFFGGQDRSFKKVLLFAHAVVTGLPQEIRPLSKGGNIPWNTAPGGRIS